MHRFKSPAQPVDTPQLLHSFKPKEADDNNEKFSQKLLSPQDSPERLISPSAIDGIFQNKADDKESKDDLDGSYVAPDQQKKPPPVPERISSLTPRVSTAKSLDVSPISNCTKKMPLDMQTVMMTPRSRRPVQALPSMGNLDQVPMQSLPIDMDGPCQPPKYNEDEPEDVIVAPPKEFVDSAEKTEDDAEEDDNISRYFSSLDDDDDDEDSAEKSHNSCCEHSQYYSSPGASTERDVSEITVEPNAR